MKRHLIVLFPFVVLLFVGSAQSQKAQPDDIPTLTYDELIQNQVKYADKTVRLRAIWTYGFEWTYLCSDSCSNRTAERAWVEIANEAEQCPRLHKDLKRLGKKSDNQAEVVVIGKLLTGSGYGHMGAYNHAFEISCIVKFKKGTPDYFHQANSVVVTPKLQRD